MAVAMQQTPLRELSLFLHSAGLISLLVLIFTVSVDSSGDLDAKSAVPGYQYRCNVVLKKLALAAANFSYCSLYHSKPLTFCEGCWQEYSVLRKVQKEVKRDNDCQMYLVYAERFQIITKTMEYAEGLWSGFNCKYCYKGDGDEYSHDVQLFLSLLASTNRCFNNVTTHNNKTAILVDVDEGLHFGNGTENVCVVCKPEYSALKKQYQKMAGSNKAELICADITSAMNATRQKWSKHFKCIQVRKDIISVIALTCFFCFLPLVFYVGTKIHYDNADHRGKVKFTD